MEWRFDFEASNWNSLNRLNDNRGIKINGTQPNVLARSILSGVTVALPTGSSLSITSDKEIERIRLENGELFIIKLIELNQTVWHGQSCPG
jgi:hypothetical protein